jgi:uroporphyrinogen decarboxylase
MARRSKAGPDSGMTRRERVMASLRGEQTDRIAGSMWRHYFDREQSAEGLAPAMLEHQRRFDWDFMKVNPRASYHAEPWGVRAIYTGNDAPAVTGHPVKTERDWSKIGAVAMSAPVFKEQLKAIELIEAGLGGQTPFLATVFSPVSIASRLMASEAAFMEHLRRGSAGLTEALEAITETFVSFSKAAIGRGASGLFFATTSFATTDTMTAAEYRRLVRPWDLKLLSALPAHDFTLLHVCRGHAMLGEFAAYPVHAVNWDVFAAGNPGLAEGRALLKGKPVVGGLGRSGHITEASPAQMYGQVQGLVGSMGRRGWMVGSACTYDPGAQEGNIEAVRRALETA